MCVHSSTSCREWVWCSAGELIAHLCREIEGQQCSREKKEVNRHSIHFKKSEIFYKTEEPLYLTNSFYFPWKKEFLYMLAVVSYLQSIWFLKLMGEKRVDLDLFWQYLKDSFSWQRSRGTQLLRPKNQSTPTIWYSRGFCSILCFKDVWCLFLFVSACLDSDLRLSEY
jgi:hypothetical protein